MSDWLFKDPPNLAVITTYHVFESSPILLVSHDEDDGGWQFLPSEVVSEADAKVVALERIVHLDSSVNELVDLPLGWIATRSKIGDIWQRFRHSESSI
jgi:hypothetical protein